MDASRGNTLEWQRSRRRRRRRHTRKLRNRLSATVYISLSEGTVFKELSERASNEIKANFSRASAITDIHPYNVKDNFLRLLLRNLPAQEARDCSETPIVTNPDGKE